MTTVLKVDKVVADTSELLLTKKDIFKTSRLACFIEGDY